jgi:Tol biopolymer transport system component
VSRIPAVAFGVLLTALSACGDDGPGGSGPAETGSLELTTVSTGDDLDGNGYAIEVDGEGVGTVEANGAATVAEVTAGDREVRLTGVQANCDVAGENPRTVSVTGGAAAEVAFEVECENALIGQIAFFSDRDGNMEIYAMNQDGTGQTRLTNNAADDRGPAVSPDGTRILFRSDRDGDAEVYVMNADGSGAVNLTNNPGTDHTPAWSPDGSRIAFASDRNGDQEIFVMNADGTGAVNLTSSPGSEEVYPAWTPDGQRILFATARDGDAEIYIMNADGSDQTNLTNDPDSDITPSVSPDGRVVFLTNRTGDGEIFAMNLDGSSPVNLTNSPGSEEQVPSWSSDGSRIAFASDRTVDIELFVANADGSSPQNLSNNAALIDAPGTAAWGP